MDCNYRFDGYPMEMGRTTSGCQFHVPDSALVTFDHKPWCPFHLPLENERGQASPKAEWQEKKIRFFEEQVQAYIDHAYKQSGPIDLTGVVFPEKIGFTHLFTADRPVRHVLFGDADFRGEADFQRCVFPWWVRFDDAVFRARALFLSTTFKFVSFESARFTEEALFLWSDFQDYTDFRRSLFEGSATFEGTMEAPCGRTFKEVTFEGARFRQSARYNNRRFLNTSDFSGVQFGLAPEFHGCQLHQDSRFVETRFDDQQTPQAPAAYRALKRATEQIQDRDLSALFYTLEMKSRRAQTDTSPLNGFFLDLYLLTSRFGLSVGRPLLGMSMVTALFWLFNTLFARHASPRLVHADILQYTVEQIVRPFCVWSTAYPPQAAPWVQTILEHHPILFRLVSTVHTTAFFLFFFLLLLGLRRRLTL